MRTAALALTAMAAVIVLATGAFGLAGETTESVLTDTTHWPTGTAALLESEKRVYSQFVGFHDHFYYCGNAQVFNRFIARYAQLKETPHILVVHPGIGTVKKVTEERSVAYDWQVTIGLPVGPGGEIDRSSVDGKWPVNVDLWIRGQIDVSQVRLPANVKLMDASEVSMHIPIKRIPRFATYLFEDEKTTGANARKIKLSDIKLKPEPLFTEEDLVYYNWKDHSFALAESALKRMPKPNACGIPFVVTANGKRIYLGAFWAPDSSSVFLGPSIEVFGPGNTYRISRGVIESNDSRSDSAIQQALKDSGKLRE